METFELSPDEVVLYKGMVTSKNYKGSILVTLTSQKLVFEREKGIFKKERELIETIALDTVKVYNDVVQVKQKGNTVGIQTSGVNIDIMFTGMIEARKFTGKMIDTVTGTTLVQRSSEKLKGAISMVDDTLGVDTRETIKGLIENGVKGTILNGIGKKK